MDREIQIVCTRIVDFERKYTKKSLVRQENMERDDSKYRDRKTSQLYCHLLCAGLSSMPNAIAGEWYVLYGQYICPWAVLSTDAILYVRYDDAAGWMFCAGSS